jgi:hypothetical protein
MNTFGIYLSNTDLWLLAIVGGCLTWLVTHWLSIERDRRNSLRPLVIEFKSAFSDEIAAFREESISEHMLRHAFKRHRDSVNKILPLLGKIDQYRLRRAWGKYCRTNEGLDPEIGVTSYEHPEFSAIGKHRLTSLHSCLDHLA